jgi:hypothetical protein
MKKTSADKQPPSTKAAKGTARKPRGKPWPKGVSGNPKGRPPTGQSLTEVLKQVLGEGGKEEMAKKLYAMALGDKKNPPYFPALKYIYDRIDGEPLRAIQATVENWEPPVVMVSRKEEKPDGEDPVAAPAETG